MMSKEQLQNVMDLHYSKLVAEQLATLFQERFQKQWDTVVAELANTRRSNQSFKEQLNKVTENNNQFEQLIENLRVELEGMRENQRKAREILKVAADELELGKDE